MTSTTAFTISHTIDQAIIDELETEFDDFRTRIANLSMEASSTLTDMFQPLGPVGTEVIDIEAIEWEQFELDLATQPEQPAQDAEVLAIVAA